MKINQIFGLLGLISLFSLLLGINIYQDYKKNSPEIVIAEEDPLPPGKKRHIPIKELTTKPVEVTMVRGHKLRECSRLFESVGKMSMKDLYHSAEKSPIDLIDQSCFNSISRNSGTPYWDKLYNLCLRNRDFSSPDCKSNLIYYRIMMLALMHEGEEDLRTLDDSVIISKLLWPFLNGSPLSEQILEVCSIYADTLTLRLPNLYAAHKAKLTIKFLRESNFDSDEEEGAYQDILNELASFDVEDDLSEFPLTRAFVTIKSLDDLPKARAVFEKFINDHPNHFAGHYYMAAMAWKFKSREMTETFLKKALELGPNNKRVLATIEQLATAKFEDEIFKFTLSFNFSDI